MKIFGNNNSLKSKVRNIHKDIERVMKEVLKEKFDVLHYGAYDINPIYLVFWICVDTDDTKERLAKDKELNGKLRNVLLQNEYPIHAINDVYIGFESQETVDRDSHGDWYLHFK